MKYRLIITSLFILIADYFGLISIRYDERVTAQETQDYITAFDFNPLVDKYATAHSLDWTVRIWDAGSNRVLHTIQIPDLRSRSGGPSHIRQVVFSPSGDKLAICVWGDIPHGLILIADIATGTALVEIVDIPSVNTIDWSPDGRLLAGIFATSPFTVTTSHLGLWDANTGEKLNDYFIGMTSPLFVDWHPSEAKVAFTTLDEVVVWDIEHWQELYRLPADEVDAISVAWSPVGDRLASVGEEGIVRVWDGDTGDLLREIKMRAFERGLPRVFWSGDGNLVGAIVGNRIEAWNAQSGRRAFSEEVAQPVVGLIWKPDGRIIAASQDDNNAAEMPLLQTLRE